MSTGMASNSTPQVTRRRSPGSESVGDAPSEREVRSMDAMDIVLINPSGPRCQTCRKDRRKVSERCENWWTAVSDPQGTVYSTGEQPSQMRSLLEIRLYLCNWRCKCSARWQTAEAAEAEMRGLSIGQSEGKLIGA